MGIEQMQLEVQKTSKTHGATDLNRILVSNLSTGGFGALSPECFLQSCYDTLVCAVIGIQHVPEEGHYLSDVMLDIFSFKERWKTKLC